MSKDRYKTRLCPHEKLSPMRTSLDFLYRKLSMSVCGTSYKSFCEIYRMAYNDGYDHGLQAVNNLLFRLSRFNRPKRGKNKPKVIL